MATVTAFLIACFVLLIAVLPAEYGVDPTGVGRALGFSRLSSDASPTGNDTVANTTSLFRYRLTWPLVIEAGEDRAGYTREGTTTNVFVNLEKENLTRVVAWLTWQDRNETGGQRTKPDLFELQVLAPDGTMGVADLGRNGADGSGNVSADLVWRSAPLPQEVRAATDDEAAQEAKRIVSTDRTGLGEWTIRVSMLDAGDLDAPNAPLAVPAGDEGNDWTLALTVEAYRFDHDGLNGSKEREDRVRLEIPAGTGLEYKFDLDEGAPLDYAWNTTGANLYYDFHGERRNDTSGAFSSHKSGVLARDEGFFTAPFDGTHGWFWENRNTEPVTVELVTSGVYEIIGKK